MNKMIYVLAIAIVVFVGWKLTSRTAYESAEYTVLESDGSFEIREYPELLMATTPMTQMSGGDGSFNRLFQYISGQNEEQQKVAMTTPVFMETKSPDAAGQMGFVVPKKVAESTTPTPANSQVQLNRRAAGKFAVLRFAGRIDSKIQSQQLQKLRDWIESQGLQPANDRHEIAGYDPPWTPGPVRRNEILIRLLP